jgi:hypothetical protein
MARSMMHVPRPRRERRHDPAVRPAFLGASLALAILLGVSTGAWELLAMAFSVGPVLPSHLQLHAHVQLLGFAGLLFAGAAFKALPRVAAAAPAASRPARFVLAALGGGVFLRAMGQPVAPWAAGRLVCLVAGALEAAGIYLFAAWALPALLRSGPFRTPRVLHAFFAALFLAAAGIVAAAQALRLAGHAEAELPATFVEPFYAIGLYGFALSFGFALVSGFGDPEKVPERRKSGSVVVMLQLVGVACLLGAAALSTARNLFLLGTVLVASSAIGFLGSRAARGRRSERGGVFQRLALVALLLFSLVSLGAVAAEIAGKTVHKFVWDGARHLLTMGFVTLLLLDAELRFLPGARVRTRLARAGIGLAGAAALLRALQIPVAFGWGGLPLYRVAGTSGVFAFAGLLVYAAGVLPALRKARPVVQASR